MSLITLKDRILERENNYFFLNPSLVSTQIEKWHCCGHNTDCDVDFIDFYNFWNVSPMQQF